MKKSFLLLLIIFNLLSLAAQTVAEKARIKINNDWKAYLQTTES